MVFTCSMSSVDEARLGNPVYAALSGEQSRYAQSRGRALSYQPDVAPFFALPAEPAMQDWANAAAL
jgi:hypothetical protein